MDVFSLMAKLTLDTSEYEDELGNAEKSASGFGSALKSGLATAGKASVAAITAVGAASAAAGGALLAGVSDVASVADTIDKESQKLGITAEAYQEWEAVLQHTGGDISNLKPAIRTLSKAIETGSDAFEQLGISAEEVSGLSKEELFSKVITQLQGMEEGTERTYLAQQLLGRSSMELGALLNTSAEDTQAMKDRVHELGGVLSDDAVKAGAAFQDNLQDMQTALSGAKRGITQEFLPSMSMLMDGFTKLISDEEGANEAIDAGIDALVGSFEKVIPKITKIFSTLIPKIVQTLIKSLPTLVKSGFEIIKSIGDGILGNMDMVMDVIFELINTIINLIVENLPQFIEGGIYMLTSLMDGLSERIPDLIPVILLAIETIVNALIDNAPLLLESGLKLMMALAMGIVNNIPVIIQKLPEIISKIITGLAGMSGQIVTAGVELIVNLAAGIVKAIPDLVKALPKVVLAIIEGIGAAFSNLVTIGGNLIKGLWEGISSVGDWLREKISGFFGGVVDSIKNFFGIHSPSTLFADIGENLDKGLAEGISDNLGMVEDSMDDMADTVDGMTPEMNVNTTRGAWGSVALAGGYGGNIVIPVYIGEDLIQNVIVRAVDLENYVSGGR